LRRPISLNRFPTLMPAHYARGKVRLAEGDRAGAIEQIELGLELARNWVEPMFVAYGCLALADAQDGYVEKRAQVRKARRLADQTAGRGRIGSLVAAAERQLAIQQPPMHTSGTVHVEPLTAREQDVIRQLERSISLREIAAELFVSHNTVKGHTKAIYRKLGVSTRENAVATARKLGLI
jgi:LuxR family maltose regulon positive regulatory protein